ncbi:hypothetical protein [Bacillus cereus]|uniref:hypothetical protein n=1 Tax=Bacillus cereus TaxID=1396 RepID=UPI0018CC8285|nr:hypothetical protein [Bacillus cereus]
MRNEIYVGYFHDDTFARKSNVGITEIEESAKTAVISVTTFLSSRATFAEIKYE